MGKLIDNIDNPILLHNYLREKGENHSSYKYYTSLRVIEAIIAEHSLFLSKGDNWNDLQDRANFNPDDEEEVRFGICMSFSKSENVAMWMLYGKNDGYMIDFGKNVIKDCLKSSKLSCGRIREGKYSELVTCDASAFSVEVVDIIYFGEPKDGDLYSYYIKRSNEIVQNCKSKVINQIKYCKKTLPWQYECECRLVLKVKKSILGIERCDTAKITFDKNFIDELKERIFHSPNHDCEYLYEKSRLTGKIQWNI